VLTNAQKPDFVSRRNGRICLKRWGRQFSRLLTAEVCASAVVMLGTPCSEVVWRVLATHYIHQFPLHFPTRASLCAITFQPDCIKCILFWNHTVHVSDGLSVHHQEFKTVHTATGICQTDTAVYSLELLMMDGTTFRNMYSVIQKKLFWYIGASSWFYYRNSITMHGPMNIKFTETVLLWSQRLRHNCFHIEIDIKFVTAKILLQRLKQVIIVRRRIHLI